MSLCSVHNQEFRLVPAGTSKSTGKPYNAFLACPERGCRAKPPAGEQASPRAVFDASLNQAAAQMNATKKDTTITRLAIAKSLIESSHAWSLETQQEAEKWLAWVENKQALAQVIPTYADRGDEF